MMSGRLLYPRLPRSTAQQIYAEQKDASLDDLYSMGALHHPDAAPGATGGHPAPHEKLLEVQATIRRIAAEAGYPAPLSGSTQRFDRPCGTALYEIMEIVPADAAREGVWSFLSLVVVPEIGPWRFPSRAEERLLGRPRNVLRRLWWRAWALGPDLTWAPENCEPLGEDEFVNIMERPSLGGNRRTAQSLRDALWRAEKSGLDIPRSELMRQLARRLRAARSHILLDALTDSELTALLDELTEESVHDLQGLRTTTTHQD